MIRMLSESAYDSIEYLPDFRSLMICLAVSLFFDLAHCDLTHAIPAARRKAAPMMILKIIKDENKKRERNSLLNLL